MAQQPVGSNSPYLSSNEGSTGAVFFDQGPDLLSVHMENLRGVDKVIEERQKNKVAQTKLMQTLLSAKNPDINGIFPAHTEQLQKEGQGIQEAQANLLRLGAPDANNPVWITAYNELNNKKQILQQHVAASKSINQHFNQVDASIRSGELKDKIDPEYYNKKVADLQLMSIDDAAMEAANLSSYIKPAIPDLDLAIDDFMKKTYTKPQVTSTFEKDASGNVNLQHKVTENITPAQINYIAKNAALMPALNRSLDKAWQAEKQMFPDKVAAIVDNYIATGYNPTVAEDNAKADYMQGKLMAGHYQKSDEWIPKGETQQAKVARIYARVSASELKEAQRYQGDAANLAQLGRVDGADKAFATIKLEPYNSVIEVDGEEKAVKVPNSIISIDPADPQDLSKGWDVVTSESMELAKKAQGQFVDPANSALGTNVVLDAAIVHLPTLNSVRMYVGNRAADKKWAQGVDLAFRAKDAVLPGNQDYDPDKYLSKPSTPAQTVKKTTSTTVSGTAPKKGDTRPVKGGTAIFDGTKWVMK